MSEGVIRLGLVFMQPLSRDAINGVPVKSRQQPADQFFSPGVWEPSGDAESPDLLYFGRVHGHGGRAELSFAAVYCTATSYNQ